MADGTLKPDDPRHPAGGDQPAGRVISLAENTVTIEQPIDGKPLAPGRLPRQRRGTL